MQDSFLISIVCSKEGFLFDKEAILQYIITKKTEYAKKLKEFERQRQAEDSESAATSALEEQKKLLKFINHEKNIATTSVGSRIGSRAPPSDKPGTSASAISNMSNGRDKELPSFWVPSQTPAAKVSRIAKPDPTIMCPVSQKPFKAKDLIDVKFTLVNDPSDSKSLIAKENRYMCAVTHDILSNSVPCAVLRPT